MTTRIFVENTPSSMYLASTNLVPKWCVLITVELLIVLLKIMTVRD